eukprot:8413789-Alexandrium_andersonii.AAC.2
MFTTMSAGWGPPRRTPRAGRGAEVPLAPACARTTSAARAGGHGGPRCHQLRSRLTEQGRSPPPSLANAHTGWRSRGSRQAGERHCLLYTSDAADDM